MDSQTDITHIVGLSCMYIIQWGLMYIYNGTIILDAATLQRQVTSNRIYVYAYIPKVRKCFS